MDTLKQETRNCGRVDAPRHCGAAATPDTITHFGWKKERHCRRNHPMNRGATRPPSPGAGREQPKHARRSLCFSGHWLMYS